MPTTPKCLQISPQWLYVGLSCFHLVGVNLGSAVVTPFLPVMAPEFGLERSGVAFVMASYSACQIVAALCSGPAASHFGRIRVLSAGSIIVGVANIAFGVAPDVVSSPKALLVLFCLSRGAQGVGSSLATTCLLAMLTDATPATSRGQVMGFAEFASASGWTVGPPVGALLFAAGGWIFPFQILGVLPIVGLAFFLAGHYSFSTKNEAHGKSRNTESNGDTELQSHTILEQMPEEGTSKTKGHSKKPVLQLLREVSSWQLYLASSCSGLIMGAWGLWDLGYTVWMTSEFDLSEEAVGFYFAIPPLCYMIASMPAGHFTDKFDRRAVVAGGLVAEGLGFIVAAGWLASFLPWADCITTSSRGFRLAVSVIGCVILGTAGPFVIVPCLPEMTAVAQSNIHISKQITSALAVALPQDEEDVKDDRSSDDNDEDATNIVTSIFTFTQNLGGFCGPLIGVPLIDAVGYRGAAGLAGLSMITHGAFVMFIATTMNGGLSWHGAGITISQAHDRAYPNFSHLNCDDMENLDQQAATKSGCSGAIAASAEGQAARSYARIEMALI